MPRPLADKMKNSYNLYPLTLNQLTIQWMTYPFLISLNNYLFMEYIFKSGLQLWVRRNHNAYCG